MATTPGYGAPFRQSSQQLAQSAAIGAVPPLLGEILVAKCKVAPEAIERALQKQREEGGLLGEVLVRLKLCDEDQLALALAVQFDLEYLRDLPRADDIPVDLIDKIPINFARQREVMPLRQIGRAHV